MFMKDGKHSQLALVVALVISAGPGAAHAQRIIQPDLADIAQGRGGWTVANRAPTTSQENGRTVVSFDRRAGDGAAWLTNLDFQNGTIEVDIRGSNTPGGSFVGIAFRGVDDTTYDAVYFRPFNFVGDNDLSRSHMVQYISHPDYTWSRLRQEHTGEYENEIANPPDPDQFFKARIVVAKPEVRVYVGDASEPCLVVNELSDRTGGRVGLWMGNTSAGSFATLVIRPAQDR